MIPVISGVIIISDSMTRDLIMPDNVSISMHPGASVNTITNLVIKHQIKVKLFTKVLIHVGVIDMINILTSKDTSYRNIQFRQVMSRFTFLLRVL